MCRIIIPYFFQINNYLFYRVEFVMQQCVKYRSKWRTMGSSSRRIWGISLLIIFVVGRTSLPLSHMQSKNYSQRIKFLVMHYTAIDYQKSVTALV